MNISRLVQNNINRNKKTLVGYSINVLIIIVLITMVIQMVGALKENLFADMKMPDSQSIHLTSSNLSVMGMVDYSNIYSNDFHDEIKNLKYVSDTAIIRKSKYMFWEYEGETNFVPSLLSVENNFFDILNLNLKGDMPKNSQEVVISSIVAENKSVNIGDEIVLSNTTESNIAKVVGIVDSGLSEEEDNDFVKIIYDNIFIGGLDVDSNMHAGYAIKIDNNKKVSVANEEINNIIEKNYELSETFKLSNREVKIVSEPTNADNVASAFKYIDLFIYLIVFIMIVFIYTVQVRFLEMMIDARIKEIAIFMLMKSKVIDVIKYFGYPLYITLLAATTVGIGIGCLFAFIVTRILDWEYIVSLKTILLSYGIIIIVILMCTLWFKNTIKKMNLLRVVNSN